MINVSLGLIVVASKRLELASKNFWWKRKNCLNISCNKRGQVLDNEKAFTWGEDGHCTWKIEGQDSLCRRRI